MHSNPNHLERTDSATKAVIRGWRSKSHWDLWGVIVVRASQGFSTDQEMRRNECDENAASQ